MYHNTKHLRYNKNIINILQYNNDVTTVLTDTIYKSTTLNNTQ